MLAGRVLAPAKTEASVCIEKCAMNEALYAIASCCSVHTTIHIVGVEGCAWEQAAH